MNVATIHNEAQVEGKPLEDPPCQGDRGGEDRYNGRLVPGANVLGLVAAAAALGAAAAFKKEEGKLVVEVGGWERVRSIRYMLSDLLQFGSSHICAA